MADEPQDKIALPRKAAYRTLQELGLVSLYRASLDTKLLVIQRFVRVFGYGASTIILVSHLSALGISDTRIGLFMTLTLVGDVVLSLILTFITDSVGRRYILAAGAILMAISGLIFGVASNFWILLVGAIFGVISPSGNEVGPFRAIEESTLSHLTAPDMRVDIFTWYNLAGAAGTAFGMMACGWMVDILHQKKGWAKIHAYRVVFLVYGAIGILKLILTICLSRKCELDPRESQTLPVAAASASEQAPLLDDQNLNSTQLLEKKPRRRLPMLSQITPEGRRLFIIIAVLYAFDGIGSNVASLSWVTNFVQRKFSLEEGYVGSIFFTLTIMSSCSVLAGASIARRLGNVKTMVVTHVPSAVALLFLGFPSSLTFVIVLLVIWAVSRYMEVAPRSAFLATILLPGERTAVIGALNVVKTGAGSVGPIITGALAERHMIWAAFVLAGATKLIYDLFLFCYFVNYRNREEMETNEDDVDTVSEHR